MSHCYLTLKKNGKCCGTVLVISCEVLLHTFNVFNPPYESLCGRIISI